MKKTAKKLLAFFLCLVSVCSIFSTSVFALDWDGSSGGGAGQGKPADCRGFAVRRYPEDNCLGYRFSVVDKSGNNKVSDVIDVYRNEYYGNYESTHAYKFTKKMNKKQLINAQNSGFSTAKTAVNCYKEADLGFVTALSTPDKMSIWQAYNGNLNVILNLLGIGTISNLKNGDKILVEPIYDVQLETVYHAVTETELALYGKYLLGENSDGGSSSTAASWGFISVCTNKLYANLLYTPDGQGLWSSATELKKRATFKTIINSGYGVGIAYTETKEDFEPTLTVQKVQAWKGTAFTKNYLFGESTGYGFGYYNYVNNYPAHGNLVFFTVFFPAETQNVYCRQTVWIDGVLVSTRTGYSSTNTTYNVVPATPLIGPMKSYYKIEAQVDYINAAGVTLKYGAKKSFYIPVKPTVYRDQVAVYNTLGELQAYSGKNGSSGSVYVGQKVQAKYSYSSINAWYSSNNLYAAMMKWSNGSWIRVNSTDGVDYQNKSALIGLTNPITGASNLGYTVVPDNSGSGSNVMRFKMTTQWTSDPSRTEESTYYNIPVIRADVELVEIKLVNANGYYVSASSLECGQKVTVRYVYKNNTSTTIFVDGYNNSQKLINTSGAYKIKAGGTIEVVGETITVPKTSFNIWGGVYLSGAGLKNTSWESNGNNNEKTLYCKVKTPLSVSIVVPNASYRETTDVITSFWVTNGNDVNFYPTDGVTATVQIKNSQTGALISSQTVSSICVPANDKNLYYVKWKVPSGLNGGNVTVQVSLYQSGTLSSSDTRMCSTMKYVTCSTPDTSYSGKAPTGFTVGSIPNQTTKYASWTQYTYANGKFTKNSYFVGLSFGTVEIIPATGETHYKSGSGVWTMKSGYGISLNATCNIMAVTGTLTSSMYTLPQYVTASFPEFGYATTSTTCRTLSYVNSKWCFNTNGSYGRVHFTPIYYPDGDYQVSVVFSDVWTPGGMISYVRKTNTIKISGNAYEDWYVGR